MLQRVMSLGDAVESSEITNQTNSEPYVKVCKSDRGLALMRCALSVSSENTAPKGTYSTRVQQKLTFLQSYGTVTCKRND